MSVLQNFFQISMVVLIASVGMNLAISAFGQALTGQNISGIVNEGFMQDVNATIESTIEDAPSQIKQSSTDIVSMAFSVVSNVWNGTYLNLFLSSAFGVQNLIGYICAAHNIPTAVGNIIIFLFSFIQMFGVIYILFIIFAVPKGGASSL